MRLGSGRPAYSSKISAKSFSVIRLSSGSYLWNCRKWKLVKSCTSSAFTAYSSLSRCYKDFAISNGDSMSFSSIPSLVWKQYSSTSLRRMQQSMIWQQTVWYPSLSFHSVHGDKTAWNDSVCNAFTHTAVSWNQTKDPYVVAVVLFTVTVNWDQPPGLKTQSEPDDNLYPTSKPICCIPSKQLCLVTNSKGLTIRD